MSDRRLILCVLVGLTLCLSIWHISVQEPPIITEYAQFDNNVYDQQISSSDGVTYSDRNNTVLSTRSAFVSPTIDPKEDLKALIDLNNFEYLINQQVCNNSEMEQQDTSLPPIDTVGVILVHSAPLNWHKRKIIRDTWGQKDARGHLYFLLGAVTSAHHQNSIQEENNEFQDIIQGNFLDAYHNMTYKHVMALKWFAYNCRKLKYLIKTDDDVFVNTPALYNFLENSADKQNFLFCFKNEKSRIKRSYRSKWRVSTKEYPGWFYPPYCPGFSIVYSADVVYQLYKKAQRTKYFWIDDVHVTGTLAQYLNLNITTMGKYYLNGLQRDNLLNGYTNLTSLQPMFLFAEPNLEEKEIRKLWKLVWPNNNS